MKTPLDFLEEIAHGVNEFGGAALVTIECDSRKYDALKQEIFEEYGIAFEKSCVKLHDVSFKFVVRY